MEYRKVDYDILRRGFTSDEGYSFSRAMKDDMQNNRMDMFADVIDYLEENEIEYEQVKGNFNIYIKKDFTLTSSMHVIFDTSRKSYQYNYQKIIERINKQ